jgi:SH3-like domain-containing protein
MMATADDSAAVIATLARGEQLVVVGSEQNGFIQVQGSSATGWVKQVLLVKQ